MEASKMQKFSPCKLWIRAAEIGSADPERVMLTMAALGDYRLDFESSVCTEAITAQTKVLKILGGYIRNQDRKILARFTNSTEAEKIEELNRLLVDLDMEGPA
jgi:hypothetical protein